MMERRWGTCDRESSCGGIKALAVFDSGRSFFFSDEPQLILFDQIFFLILDGRTHAKRLLFHSKIDERERETTLSCLRHRNSTSGLYFEIPKSSVSLSLSSLSPFPSFFYYEVTCDELTNIRDMHMLHSRRSGRVDKDCNSRFPARRKAPFFKVDIAQRRMQDAERLRPEFCCPMHISLSIALISATCDNVFIE